MVAVRLSQIAEAYYFESYENAIMTAHQVIRQYPKSPQAYRWLAAALAQVGQQAAARSAWQELVDANPASVDTMVRKPHPGWRPEDHQHMLDCVSHGGRKDRRVANDREAVDPDQLGFDYLCMTRPLVEFAIRRSVERQSNVALKSRCRVTRFLEAPTRPSSETASWPPVGADEMPRDYQFFAHTALDRCIAIS
jgi:hypothetical protein